MTPPTRASTLVYTHMLDACTTRKENCRVALRATHGTLSRSSTTASVTGQANRKSGPNSSRWGDATCPRRVMAIFPILGPEPGSSVSTILIDMVLYHVLPPLIHLRSRCSGYKVGFYYILHSRPAFAGGRTRLICDRVSKWMTTKKIRSKRKGRGWRVISPG